MFPTNRSLIKATAAIALLGATVPVGIAFAHGSDHDGLTSAQRTVIREATDKFRDVDEAIAAGYVPTDVCAELPDGGGGMGYHFVNPALAADAKIDPTTPEILVYVTAKDGRFRLGAIEYFVADSDQDLATDADRPTSTPGCTAPTPPASSVPGTLGSVATDLPIAVPGAPDNAVRGTGAFRATSSDSGRRRTRVAGRLQPTSSKGPRPQRVIGQDSHRQGSGGVLRIGVSIVGRLVDSVG